MTAELHVIQTVFLFSLMIVANKMVTFYAAVSGAPSSLDSD